MDKGLLLVISAPSGGGKGTILQELFAQDENLRLSVSATTRGPRPGEEHGKQYYFLSREEFEGLIQEGKMLEHAEYVGNYYGTPRQPVEDWMDQGHDVVLEIEVKGGAQVKQLMPECVSIFILPPSMKVLEKRLRGRGTEDEETIQKAAGKGPGGNPPRQGLRLHRLQRRPGGRCQRPAGHYQGGETEILPQYKFYRKGAGRC